MTAKERFESAKEIYSSYGVDVEAAIKKCMEAPVALHCWQGDDVTGFDHDGPLTGGIHRKKFLHHTQCQCFSESPRPGNQRHTVSPLPPFPDKPCFVDIKIIIFPD